MALKCTDLLSEGFCLSSFDNDLILCVLAMFQTTCCIYHKHGLLPFGIPLFKGGCPLFSAWPWQEHVLRGGKHKSKSSESSCLLVFQSPFLRTHIVLTCGGKGNCSESSCFLGFCCNYFSRCFFTSPAPSQILDFTCSLCKHMLIIDVSPNATTKHTSNSSNQHPTIMQIIYIVQRF